MKKLIIFITSNDPSVGTTVDVVNYKNFFKSPIGGCWHEDEIKILDNVDKRQLLEILDYFQILNYDYLICIFTGHGWINRSSGDTMLQLASGEALKEVCLHNIAERQLSIFDCCRAVYNDKENIRAVMNRLNENVDYSNKIREIYDAKILQTPKNYQCCLYACQKGETAEGEAGTGGVFSRLLIEAHKYVKKDVVRINDAFQVVSDLCKNEKQKPDMRSLRCPENQQLIWALHMLLDRYSVRSPFVR